MLYPFVQLTAESPKPQNGRLAKFGNKKGGSSVGLLLSKKFLAWYLVENWFLLLEGLVAVVVVVSFDFIDLHEFSTFGRISSRAAPPDTSVQPSEAEHLKQEPPWNKGSPYILMCDEIMNFKQHLLLKETC